MRTSHLTLIQAFFWGQLRKILLQTNNEERLFVTPHRVETKFFVIITGTSLIT